jgi:hypothetical protein
MRQFILITTLACLCFSGYSQKQGIGLRIGKPLGISYKKYFGLKALEFTVGGATRGWSDNYYETSFDADDDFDSYKYVSHKVESQLYLQGRYLVHNEIYVQDLEGRWDWYWGVGGILKFARINYEYIGAAPPLKERHEHRDIDLGPEAILGMEYTFQDVPVSVFVDFSFMIEVVDRVSVQPFGGAGARYNF